MHDGRVLGSPVAPHGTVDVIDGWHTREGGDGGHGIQVMLTMDDIGLEWEIGEIGSDWYLIIGEQAITLAEVAAVSHHSMTTSLKVAGEVANETFSTTTEVEAVVGDKDFHREQLMGCDSTAAGFLTVASMDWLVLNLGREECNLFRGEQRLLQRERKKRFFDQSGMVRRNVNDGGVGCE